MSERADIRYDRLAAETARKAARARAKQRVSDNPDAYSIAITQLYALTRSYRKRADLFRARLGA